MLYHRIKDDRMENRKTNSAQSVLAWRMRQGCAAPPPLTPLLLTIKLILNFAKLEENFAIHEIKNFAKISQPPYSYTICRLLLTLPSRLLEDASMRRGNATLI